LKAVVHVEVLLHVVDFLVLVENQIEFGLALEKNAVYLGMPAYMFSEFAPVQLLGVWHEVNFEEFFDFLLKIFILEL